MPPCKFYMDTILPAPWYIQPGCFVSKSSPQAPTSIIYLHGLLWCHSNLYAKMFRGFRSVYSEYINSPVPDCNFKSTVLKCASLNDKESVCICTHWDVTLDKWRPQHNGQHLIDVIWLHFLDLNCLYSKYNFMEGYSQRFNWQCKMHGNIFWNVVAWMWWYTDFL